MNKNIHNIVNDTFSKDEVLDIIIKDDCKEFRKKVSYYITKASLKKIDKNELQVLLRFSIIGKSGQMHKFAVFPIITSNGRFTGYFGTFHYLEYHGKYDTIYISFGNDNGEEKSDNKDIYSRNTTDVFRFTKHVISRYGERCNKDYSGEDGFIRFSIENGNFSPISYGDNDSRVFMRTEVGVLLGNVVNGVYHINTFIKNSMIRGYHQNNMYRKSNVPDESEAFKLNLMLNSTIGRYESMKGEHIGELIAEVNSIIDDAPHEFFRDFFGVESKKEFINTLKMRCIIENTENAFSESDEERSKYKLCIGTCIPGRF